jgi:hypothetical protein
MSRITAEFVAALARVWHRFEPPGQDMETLAEMLAPMDDAGEDMSHAVHFDMEPSDYLAGLEALAEDGERT